MGQFGKERYNMRQLIAKPDSSKNQFEIMNSPNNLLCLLLMVVCLVTCCVGISSNECQAQQRTWTDTSGTYKIEAELVKVSEAEDGLQAELLMADGKRMAIVVSMLCEADQLIAKRYHADSLKKTARQPDKESLEPENKEVVSAHPEDGIVSRPIGAPLEMATKNLDNRNITTLKFDPASAIRLDREIQRDEKGRPMENPVYLVKVTDRQLEYLPRNVRTIVDQLVDPKVAVDVKRRAIDSLKKKWPQGRHPGLLNVMINMLSHNDKFLRLSALDLLANHDSDQSLIYIFARIDDVSFDVRWRTYEILTQLRDPRIIPELCERLDGSDRTKIAGVLQAFGSTSTPWVHPWIAVENDESVLLNACQLLGKIGDLESLETLQKVVDHESLLIRSQAENSIDRIRKRVSARASKSPKRR